MTKKKMLNGMSESDFYSLYPTEDHYKKAMGGEMSTMQTGGEQISGLTVDEFNKAPINIENDLRYQYYNDNDSQPQSQQEITSEILNRRIQEVGRERALKELNTSFNPTQEFLSGGDVKNIMKQLIKRQEGGNGVVGSDKQATSIDTAKK